MNNSVTFLNGGGEMGALTRAYDWNKNELGPPENWPQSLKTILSVLLNSKFPMFLFWGEGMIQFYNDAYRPSLGSDGKHLEVLGNKAADFWTEGKEDVLSLVQSVRETGEGTYREDHPHTLLRDGKLQEVFWTSGYSAVMDESGKIGGVLVVCTETTKVVNQLAELTSISERFKNLVMQAPAAIAVFTGDDLKAEIVNDEYLLLVDRKREEFEGKPLYESLPEVQKYIEDIVADVQRTGKAYHAYEFEIDIRRNGELGKAFFNFVYEPLIENEVSNGFMVVATEVTGQVKALKRVEDSEARLRSVINSAPEAIVLYLGRELILDMPNQPYIDMLGKGEDIAGKPLSAVMPELLSEGQPFLRILDDVFTTGKEFSTFDTQVKLIHNGVMREHFYDFSYTPVKNNEGEIYAILQIASDVTERVDQRHTLEESEAKFRTMAEATEVFIGVGDETSSANYFNQAWTNLTGRNLEQLLDYGWADLVHPEDKESWLRTYLDAYDKKEPFSGEFRLSDRNGNYHWLLTRGRPRFNPNGSFAGYISSSINITERKAVEEQLRQNEEQMRAMIESAPFPIGVYIGREMRISLANQQIMDVWGKGNDIIGKTYYEVLPELEDQQIYENLDAVFVTGKAFNAKNQRVDLVVDGKLQPYYFHYSFTPLFDSKGEVYGVMNTAAEITDLILTQQKLQSSEQNLRSMILQAPVAMCILLGPDHVVEVANDMMIELWGKPVETVMNKPIFEGLPDAKEQGLEKLLDEVYTLGTTFRANEMPVQLLRNGKYEDVYQNFVYEPYRGGNNEIAGVLAVTIDVTAQVMARKEIEEIVRNRTIELAEANAELHRSNAELGQFAYIASHDLQEPLRKISVFLQMLETNLGEIDEKSKGFMEKINSSASRMTKLIRDVLAYSQLSKENTTFREVNMDEVVDEIRQDFDLLIQQKNVTFITGGLPAVRAIPLQMSQLMSNLIANALKFSKPDSEPVVKIYSRSFEKEELQQFSFLAQDQSYVTITVEDNGIGFSQEYAEQIFHIFQRLHAKTSFEGTGIGLSMCKKIANNHSGHIYATSSEGRGASFHVILPVD